MNWNKLWNAHRVCDSWLKCVQTGGHSSTSRILSEEPDIWLWPATLTLLHKYQQVYPENRTLWSIAALMSGQNRRQWANLKTALVQHHVLVVASLSHKHYQVYPANRTLWSNAALMLGQRHRQRSNLKTSLVQHHVLGVASLSHNYHQVYPSNARHWPNVGLVSGQRHRWCPHVKSSLCSDYLIFW